MLGLPATLSCECLGHSQCIDLLRWFLAVLWVVEWFGISLQLQGFRRSGSSFSEMLPYEAEWLGAVLATLCLLLGIEFLRSRVQLGLVLSVIGLVGTQVPEIRQIITLNLRWATGGLSLLSHRSWPACVSIECMLLTKPLCYTILASALALRLRRLRHAG
jgi:hypothetical protein